MESIGAPDVGIDGALILPDSGYVDATGISPLSHTWGSIDEQQQNPLLQREDERPTITESDSDEEDIVLLEPSAPLPEATPEPAPTPAPIPAPAPLRRSTRTHRSPSTLHDYVHLSGLLKTKVWEDNSGALVLVASLEPKRTTSRSKHFAIKYHWLREQLEP